VDLHEAVRYTVSGGEKLQGTVIVQGAKNAALPMIAASLLVKNGQTVLRNVPLIRDIYIAIELARAVGAKVEVHEDEKVLVIDATNLTSSILPAELTDQIRGSVLFLPPVLIRTGEVIIEGVGGCNLGARKLDFHYRGFVRLGATVSETPQRIHVQGNKLVGASMYLDMPSHTGTENLITAACFAEGTSMIENAAMEPEIADFANFLNQMGAKVSGVGTGFVQVEGIQELHATDYTVMADRLDAGALAMAVAATGGEATLVGANLNHFGVVRAKLEQMGVEFSSGGAVAHVRRVGPLKPINVITWPYPGFATDLQSPIMALACLADGISYIRENVFEARFALGEELNKLGADIRIENSAAVIRGPKPLHGGSVFALDIRSGIALVIAGLVANGETIIDNGHMIDRGYMSLPRRLSSLGAKITREVQPSILVPELA
jgi:UDP-N-acetylglucosamine 1-carboxyvinyltransferase